MMGLFKSKQKRREQLEREWQAEVDAYRDGGGRNGRPDAGNPFLLMMNHPEDAGWRREFMTRFDSRTGKRVTE